MFSVMSRVTVTKLPKGGGATFHWKAEYLKYLEVVGAFRTFSGY